MVSGDSGDRQLTTAVEGLMNSPAVTAVKADVEAVASSTEAKSYQGLGKVKLRPIRSDLRRKCWPWMQDRHGFQDHGGLYAP